MKVINKRLKKYTEAIPVYDLQMYPGNPCFSLDAGIISHNTIPAGSPARKCLVPPSDYHVIVHVDYSQAELVVLSALSEDPDMIKSFLDGKDMHKFIASKAFQIPYDDVSKEQRRFAKTIGFSIIYGKSVENVAIDITGGDVARAQGLFDSFYNAFPRIKVWMQSKRDEVDTYGYVTTILGNKLAVDTSLPGNGAYRVAINAPIQGLANTIAGTAMYEFSEACEQAGFDTHPIGFTHDAYDDATLVDTIVEYIDLMVFKLQNEVYQKTGIPMRIDYEVGSDSFNMCGYSLVSRVDNLVVIELDGTEEALTKTINVFRKSKRFKVVNVEELKTETETFGYEELMTVGKALKYEWGKTITKKTVKVTLEY